MRTSVKSVAALIASTIATAMAQESRLSVRVSTDGRTWLPSATVMTSTGGSSRAYVGYFMSYEGPGSPDAFASITFQPVFGNIRPGVDVVAPFANRGTNLTGGAIDPRDDYAASGGFGRVKPWAATGPSTSMSYVVHQHRVNSSGSPAMDSLRIARNDIWNWVGAGPTAGTGAINNFNGAGGVTCSQRQFPDASDPARVAGTRDVLLMVLALDLGAVPVGSTRSVAADVPLEGVIRDAATGVRRASWFANRTETSASIFAPVVVEPARIDIANCDFAIVRQPTAVATCRGASASLEVSVAGSPRFQWRKDGVPVANATLARLQFPSLDEADEGTYDCVLTSTCGGISRVTNPVAVEIQECCLNVAVQPVSMSLCPWSSWRLSVRVDSDLPPSYQWRRDGVDIPGATASELVVGAPDRQESYDCRITNGCRVVLSQPALIDTIYECYEYSCEFVAQPQAMTVPAGSVASMFARVFVPNPSWSVPDTAYRWHKDGAPLDDTDRIRGSRARLLLIEPCSVADAGRYHCEVAGPCGQQVSAAAELQVVSAERSSLVHNVSQSRAASAWSGGGPSCWSRPNPGDSTVEGGAWALSYQIDCVGPGSVDFSSLVSPHALFASLVGVSDGEPTGGGGTYVAEFDVSGPTPFRLDATVTGGSYATGRFRLERIAPTAEVVSDLVLPGFSGDCSLVEFWGPNRRSLNRRGTLTPGRYRVDAAAASDPWSPMASLSFDLRFPIECSIWTTQPRSVLGVLGGSATFAAETSNPDESYLWCKDGIALQPSARIVGVSSTRLTISDLQPSDAGRYSCVAVGCGTRSTEATLEAVGCDVSWGPLATHSMPARARHGQAFSPWFAGTLVFGGLDQSGTPLNDTWFRQAGEWRSLPVDGPAARHGHFMVSLASRVLLVGGRDPSGPIDDAWVWDGSQWIERCPSFARPPARSDHAMAFDPVSNRVILVGGLDRAGSSLSDAWELDCTGDQWRQLPPGPPARHGHAMAFDPTSGEVLVVGGRDATGARVDVWALKGDTWRQAAPGELTPRFGHAIAFDGAGDRLVLFGGTDGTNSTVDALIWAGDGWVRAGDVDASRARRNHALTFDPAEGMLLLTGGVRPDGTVAADAWTGNALAPTAVLVPASQTVSVGDTLRLDASVRPAQTSVRWRRDGVDLADDARIQGSATSGLRIGSFGPGDQGVYDCVVVGPCDTVTSANVVVSCTPRFTSHPENTSVRAGESAGFSAGVASDTGTAFRWLRNDVPLDELPPYRGTASQHLFIEACDQPEAGAYVLVAINACGESRTAPVTLAVECLSDFNRDGGTDAGDVDAFFIEWENGTTQADVNRDGGVDGSDLFLFFSRWQNGC